MDKTDPQLPPRPSRVDRRLKDLAQAEPNAKELSAQVSGTSEETAALFGARETLIPYE